MRNCCPHNTHTHSRSQPSDHSADDDDKAATAMPLLVLITIIYSLYPQGSYYISANYCIGIASSSSSTNGSASGRMCVVAHSSTRLCPINKAHNFLQHDLLELHYRLIAVGLYSNHHRMDYFRVCQATRCQSWGVTNERLTSGAIILYLCAHNYAALCSRFPQNSCQRVTRGYC